MEDSAFQLAKKSYGFEVVTVVRIDTLHDHDQILTRAHRPLLTGNERLDRQRCLRRSCHPLSGKRMEKSVRFRPDQIPTCSSTGEIC